MVLRVHAHGCSLPRTPLCALHNLGYAYTSIHVHVHLAELQQLLRTAIIPRTVSMTFPTRDHTHQSILANIQGMYIPVYSMPRRYKYRDLTGQSNTPTLSTLLHIIIIVCIQPL